MLNFMLLSNGRRLLQYQLKSTRKYSQQLKPSSGGNKIAKAKSKWKVYPLYFLIKNLRPDKVPGDYLMVYRSSLETYVNFAITIATGSLLAVPFYVTYSVKMDPTIASANSDEWFSMVIASVCAFGIASFLLIIGVRCPLRIYYSLEKNNYLMFIPRLIPFKTKCLEVQPGTILLPDSSSALTPWRSLQHVHSCTNKKIILIESNFEMPVYYNKLLKY